MIVMEATEVLGENPAPLPLCLPTTPREMAWKWARASALELQLCCLNGIWSLVLFL
jgi:hypothetical protein